MTTTRSTLPVPGATLYYEIRGEGPVLLLICGGVYDAALFGGLAAALSDGFRVVTYDRRGNSRSELDGPPSPQTIAEHANDASLLLAEVAGTEPALVFGNSSGAVIGLELVARHPEQVRSLVAHEPPAWELLPDGEPLLTATEAVSPTYHAEGADAAGVVLGAALGMEDSQAEPFSAGEPAPEVLAMFGRMAQNNEFFLGYEVSSFGRHRTDLAGLRAATTRIVPAAGSDSAGEPPHRVALALAAGLGVEPVILPGGHGGFASAAPTFAARLGAVLAD